MRKITASVLAALLMFTLASCQQTPSASVTPHITASDIPETSGIPDIGIALPSKDNTYQRWERDGQYIKEQLEANGYTVELMYADNKQYTQNSQIKELIAKGCKLLIIASIDGGSLGSVLAQTKADGVTVIAYDRLITNTGNVDYFVTFDYFRFGALQGEYIEDALRLKDGKGPFNIELFTGSLDDGNVMFYYEGAMSILRQYIENDQLVVKSGQIDMMDVGTFNWSSEEAKARMDDLLADYYTGDKLDAVLSPNDSVALGVIESLEDAGYTEFPVITGMDCEKANVMAMKSGKQSMSVFKDTRILAAKVVEMVEAIMTGREVPVTGTEHHSNGIDFASGGYNGVKYVPTFLCDPAVVTADSIREILIDGGYYTEADLE